MSRWYADGSVYSSSGSLSANTDPSMLLAPLLVRCIDSCSTYELNSSQDTLPSSFASIWVGREPRGLVTKYNSRRDGRVRGEVVEQTECGAYWMLI